MDRPKRPMTTMRKCTSVHFFAQFPRNLVVPILTPGGVTAEPSGECVALIRSYVGRCSALKGASPEMATTRHRERLDRTTNLTRYHECVGDIDMEACRSCIAIDGIRVPPFTTVSRECSLKNPLRSGSNMSSTSARCAALSSHRSNG
jgi:hypothetical protein